MKQTRSPFGDRIGELAAAGDKKYKEIAHEIGVSAPLFARILSGARNPQDSLVEKCVDVFKLSEDDAEELRLLAEISKDTIKIEPRTYDEARKIVAFVREIQCQN